jgi:hypothetical protein
MVVEFIQCSAQLVSVTHLLRAVGPEAASGENPGGLLLFWTSLVARTIVYIDGFSLYHGRLKARLTSGWVSRPRAVPPDTVRFDPS